MPNIRALDMKLVDDIFEMGGGYVLDFSDRSMSTFFAEELNVDIDDDTYRDQGGSKAKRLRCYLNKVDAATAAKTLRALWDYREGSRKHRGREEWVDNAEGRFQSLLNRMQGKPDARPADPPKAAYDRPKVLALKQRLIELPALVPQPRGYAFEAWLRDAFNFYGPGRVNDFATPGDVNLVCGRRVHWSVSSPQVVG